MTKFSDRPTPDLIVTALTGVVCFIVVFTVLAITATEIWRPEADTSRIVSRVAGLVTTMTGAIVGYIAGRGVPRTNGNGHRPPE
jgi:hypothetical protein